MVNSTLDKKSFGVCYNIFISYGVGFNVTRIKYIWPVLSLAAILNAIFNLYSREDFLVFIIFYVHMFFLLYTVH